MDEKFQDAVVALCALVMQYATVHRITFLADGVTPESDTDHTVMVGLISCAVAQQLEPRLDIGLVAQFSLVHDLVEAYAGDTNTFGGLSAGAHADKEARESAALARIQTELTDGTLIGHPDLEITEPHRWASLTSRPRRPFSPSTGCKSPSIPI